MVVLLPVGAGDMDRAMACFEEQMRMYEAENVRQEANAEMEMEDMEEIGEAAEQWRGWLVTARFGIGGSVGTGGGNADGWSMPGVR